MSIEEKMNWERLAAQEEGLNLINMIYASPDLPPCTPTHDYMHLLPWEMNGKHLIAFWHDTWDRRRLFLCFKCSMCVEVEFTDLHPPQSG